MPNGNEFSAHLPAAAAYHSCCRARARVSSAASAAAAKRPTHANGPIVNPARARLSHMYRRDLLRNATTSTACTITRRHHSTIQIGRKPEFLIRYNALEISCTPRPGAANARTNSPHTSRRCASAQPACQLHFTVMPKGNEFSAHLPAAAAYRSCSRARARVIIGRIGGRSEASNARQRAYRQPGTRAAVTHVSLRSSANCYDKHRMYDHATTQQYNSDRAEAGLPDSV